MSYPVNPAAPEQKPSRLNKWWPISFFIIAVVMFVIGGALIGTFFTNTADCWNSYSYNYYSNYNYDYSCSSNYDGKFYGGVVCLALGGVCKLVAWILLILYCVKRRRGISRTVITQYYNTAPPVTDPQQPYPPPGTAAYYPQQPGQYPAQAATYAPATSPVPHYAQPDFQPPSAPASPPPKHEKATTTTTTTHYP